MEHNVKFIWCFPFLKKIPVTCGGDGKLRVAVDGDARQVVPDDLVYIIKVHLVQLLWFLFDADSQWRGTAILLQGRASPLWHFGVLLSGWACAAAHRLRWCHAVGWRKGGVSRAGGLRGWGGGAAAG